jgi:hypothetical protein
MEVGDDRVGVVVEKKDVNVEGKIVLVGIEDDSSGNDLTYFARRG